MTANKHTIGKILSALGLLSMLAMMGCLPHPANVTATGSESTKTSAFDDDVNPYIRGSGRHHEAIRRAPTERAVYGRIEDYVKWILKDDERVGLSNYRAIDKAIRDNEHIEDPDVVTDYIWRTDDVYPRSCRLEEHLAIDERINLMVLVARACDRASLVQGLEERRDMLRETRQRMDDHAVCVGGRR